MPIILVVDDEEDIRQILSYNLKKEGFEVIQASRGDEALHLVNQNKPDLILLDVGAEYANYSSDMTRMVPVSGRFTDRQKAVYNAVLNVKNEATKMLVPGTLWKQYHVEVVS